jgi:hypothetical protein
MTPSVISRSAHEQIFWEHIFALDSNRPMRKSCPRCANNEFAPAGVQPRVHEVAQAHYPGSKLSTLPYCLATILEYAQYKKCSMHSTGKEAPASRLKSNCAKHVKKSEVTYP